MIEVTPELEQRLQEEAAKSGQSVAEVAFAILRDQLKVVTEAGYALEQEEFTPEVSSVAVPIRDYTRMLVGTLAVVGPSHRFKADEINNDIAPKLVGAGNELSKRLGYSA